jgi:hypothetical protein
VRLNLKGKYAMAKKKPCPCVKLVNEKLAEFNTKLSQCLTFSMSDMTAASDLCIETEKIDTKKRGPAKTVTPAYCPFCGVKL